MNSGQPISGIRELHRARGFTIIEVVVVATIAVILTAFALIKYSPTTTTNLVTEADRVSHDLRLMQMLAMNWGTPAAVHAGLRRLVFQLPAGRGQHALRRRQHRHGAQ